MKKVVKEVVEMGIAAIGLSGALLIIKKQGAADAIDCLGKQGCTLLDPNGNDVPLDGNMVRFKNPFKKNK